MSLCDLRDGANVLERAPSGRQFIDQKTQVVSIRRCKCLKRKKIRSSDQASLNKKREVYSILMKFFPSSPQIGHFSGAFPISMFPHQGQRNTTAPSKSFPARTASSALL